MVKVTPKVIYTNIDYEGRNFAKSIENNKQTKRVFPKGTDFSGGNFIRTGFYGVDLSDLILNKVDFKDAVLRHAILTASSCTGASFYSTNLFLADLIKANLSNAEFSSTLIIGTNFSGANLTRA